MISVNKRPLLITALYCIVGEIGYRAVLSSISLDDDIHSARR